MVIELIECTSVGLAPNTNVCVYRCHRTRGRREDDVRGQRDTNSGVLHRRTKTLRLVRRGTPVDCWCTKAPRNKLVGKKNMQGVHWPTPFRLHQYPLDTQEPNWLWRRTSCI